MEGRWTVRVDAQGEYVAPCAHCERLSDVMAPVVPCDDPALERALDAAVTAIVESNDVILDGEEPADGWALKLAQRAIAAGFKAAGETP